MPADFAVSDAVRSWAKEKGFSRVDDRFEHFCDWARAKGATYVDWDRALMNAIRGDWAKLDRSSPIRPKKFDPLDFMNGGSNAVGERVIEAERVG